MGQSQGRKLLGLCIFSSLLEVIEVMLHCSLSDAPNAWTPAIESSVGCGRKLIGCNMHCHGPVVLVLPGTEYHCEQSSFRWFPPSVKENPCHPLSVLVLFQRWVMTRCVCGRLMFFQLTRCPVLLGHETFGGLCRIWEG